MIFNTTTPRILDFNNLSIDEVKILNDIYDELKKEYHELVTKIYDESDGKIGWLVNSLLSRSHHQSYLYLNLCYIELANRIDSKNILTKVICKNSIQKKVLKNYFKTNHRKIELACNEGIINKFRNIIYPYRQIFRNIRLSLRFILNRDNNRKEKIPLNEELTLIDIFFIPSMFSEGKYWDRYYPKMFNFIKQKQQKNIFFLPTILTKNNLGHIQKIASNSNKQFLYKHDYLKVIDYLTALISPLRMKKIIFDKYTFRGLKIEPILNFEFYNSRFNSNSFLSFLNYLFFKRLYESNIKLQHVINWFENQIIDRGFNKGINDYYPDIKSLGMIGYIPSFSFKDFHLQPIPIESKYGVLPHKIGVVANDLIHEIKKYYEKLDIITVPAFRYSNFPKIKINLSKSKQTKFNILVTLPIDLEESMNIISLIMKVLGEYTINKVSWYIKPHPSLKFNKLKQNFSIWPPLFEEKIGSFEDNIVESDLLVSNASSTIIESIAYNVPVIIASSQTGIRQNLIPKSIPKDIWDICCNPEDFIAALNRLLLAANENTKRKQVEIAENVRSNFFVPVTEENVKNFLKLS